MGGAAEEASALPPRTAREVLERGRTFLEGKGVEEFRLDAELLVAHALKLNRLGLFLELERPVDEAELSTARELLVRRGKGEPVAYLTGEREFYGRPFRVGAGCLIPRPESEHLVDEARRWWLERAGQSVEQRDSALELRRQESALGETQERSMEASEPSHSMGAEILDIGTGSGCLSVTLALELATSRVSGVDRSRPALEWARQNADLLEAEVAFHEADGLAYLETLAQGSVDLVVSNPPYVDSATKATLAREVREFEPAEALFAPPGDTDFWVRELCARVPRVLRPGGLLLVELGSEQGERALELAQSAAPPKARVSLISDLAGLDRVLALQLDAAEKQER